ncbi:hypothetical protein HYG81_18895 [Natrinema zhouii]|uniref:hypothetical protein n=1 Tax=Natrinema zhouii TaxID=1710539 RepID=UPI001CFFE26E|nr:hypothetical protein [Natrinema zhouii]UHQ97929.1 hypothetical protein HYG81_18895 [Natrinema zhouii]
MTVPIMIPPIHRTTPPKKTNWNATSDTKASVSRTSSGPSTAIYTDPPMKSPIPNAVRSEVIPIESRNIMPKIVSKRPVKTILDSGRVAEPHFF